MVLGSSLGYALGSMRWTRWFLALHLAMYLSSLDGLVEGLRMEEPFAMLSGKLQQTKKQ